MFLWYSTLLNKDNWNAYLPFGCVYFNIALFIGHFSSSYSIFLDLIKYLTQPLDHAKLNRQVYPCECVYVCMCVPFPYELTN